MLDQDDFSKLSSRGLNPFHVKKFELWCEAVREREENMLPNTPATAALHSSEELNVVTATAHSVVAEESECESGAENESERDGEEESAGQKVQDYVDRRAREISEAVSPCCVQSRQNAQNKRATRVRQGFPSTRKEGVRLHDVKPDTLKKRVL